MKKTLNVLKNLDIYASSAMIILIFIDVMLQVITRVTPNTIAVPWTVEMGSMLLCAMLWVGLGLGITNNTHIRFTLIVDKFPKARKYFDLFSDAIFFAFCMILAIYTYKMLAFYHANGTATTILRWGKEYTKLPMFIGLAVACIRLAYSFVSTIVHFKDADSLTEEKDGE